MNKSPAFCEVLVDAYPESVRAVRVRIGGSGDRDLPFHGACYRGRPDTIEYLFGLYPECLNIRNDNGYLPIHKAAFNPRKDTSKIVKFLLIHDPDCLSKPIESTSFGNIYRQGNGALPLHIVCSSRDESNVTELLYDLYPEAILIRNGRGQLPIDVVRERRATGNQYNYEERLNEVIYFLGDQMWYARTAQDADAMRIVTTTCTRAPLHTAIHHKAPLGSVKLLVKGNPESINIPDNNGLCALHIAIQYSNLDIVKYLAELSPGRLNACDVNKNFPLHYACRGGNCDVVAYLLDRPMSSASVSERNVDGKLPIHLFCDSERDRGVRKKILDTPKYTETIWRLLTAYPETVLNW